MIDQLVSAVRRDLERRRAEVPLKKLEQTVVARRGDDRPFREALAREGLSLVAEFKRRSPGAGDIHLEAQVEEVVPAYERGGASAISVLTQWQHFGGTLDDLRAARTATDLPILRKDFVIDPYMLYEAAAAGADAVLLVAAVLGSRELERLYGEARSLDLDCLVEAHDREQLEAALEIDADVIGINNRNLEDLSVDVGRTFELLANVPAGKTVVSESGVSEPEQLAELDRVGVDAVLIGEVLMRAGDPERVCRELIVAEEGTRG